MRISAFVLAVFLAACGSPLPHDAAWDPLAPAGTQAKGSVHGVIRLEGESDFAGVDIRLQNADRTYSAQTGADGTFEITGVVPGTYAARYSTRYFTEITGVVAVPLGSALDLQNIDMPARRAGVKGSAKLEELINQASRLSGGVVVTLIRTASIRSGAKGAPAYRAAAASDGDGGTYSTTSGGDGSFEFTGVPAGEYDVEGYAGGVTGDGGSITVTGEDGDVSVSDMVLRPVSGYFLVQGSSTGAVLPNTYNDPAVTLLVSAFNAETMGVGYVNSADPADCVPGAPTPVQATVDVTLLGEGYNTLCVVFYDANGAASPAAVRQIYLDSVAPVAGALLINGGAAATNNPSVNLTLPANGATQSYVSTAGCKAGGAWQGYSPLAVLNLGTTQGNRTVYAAFRDDAGNETAGCVSAVIKVDTSFTSSLTFTLQGLDTVPVSGKTALPTVRALIGGLDADSVEMQIGTDTGFSGASWQAAASPINWPLSAGDGLKTLYLRARDSAGNVSGTFSKTITLDQTGPEAPGLSLTDNDSDGFALDNAKVELRWTQPAGATAYEVERYVVGSDSLFTLRFAGAANDDRYDDDVTATLGLPHYYRIRALDDMGNASGWSLAVVAFPFAPLDHLVWFDTASGTLLQFAPARGTFTLRSFLRSYAPDGAMTDSFLPDNVTSYLDNRTGVSYNDSLVFRASNSDGSLVWESSVALAAPKRESVLVAHPDFNGFAFAEDASGAVHGLYVGLEWPLQLKTINNTGGAWSIGNLLAPFEGILYAIGLGADRSGAVRACGNMNGATEFWCGREVNGVWSIADTGLRSPGNFTWKEFAVSGDGNGKTHVVAQSFFDTLVYMTDAGGTWTSFDLDTTGTTGRRPALAVDAHDNVHVAYTNLSSGQLVYAFRSAAGAWSLANVGAATGGGAAVLVDAADNVHLLYVNGAAIMHAVKPTQSGSWAVETAATGSAPERLAAAIDANGKLHVAYVDAPGDLGLNELWYVSSEAGVWGAPGVLETSVNIDTKHKLLVAVNGADPVVVYADQASEVKMISLTKRTHVTRVSTAGDGGQAGAVIAGAAGTLHAAYYRPGVQQIWYAKRVNGAWQREQAASGMLSYGAITDYMPVALAIDGTGKAHVSYGNASAGNQAFYATNAGGTWASEVIDPTTAGQQMTAIAVGADGTPHVVYHVNECCGSGQARYAKRVGGVWQITSFAADSNVYSKGISIDTSGFVHLAYDAGGYVVYQDNTSGSFARQVISDAGNLGTSIAVDKNGKSHIVYYQEYPHAVKYVNNVSGTWVTQTVDSCYCRMPKITVAPNGAIFIAVENGAQGRRIRMVTNAGGSWTAVDANLTPWGRHPSVSLDGDGTLMIGYFDSSNADYRFAAGLWGLSAAGSIQRTTPF